MGVDFVPRVGSCTLSKLPQGQQSDFRWRLHLSPNLSPIINAVKDASIVSKPANIGRTPLGMEVGTASLLPMASIPRQQRAFPKALGIFIYQSDLWRKHSLLDNPLATPPRTSHHMAECFNNIPALMMSKEE
jgi:hypothetical protein